MTTFVLMTKLSPQGFADGTGRRAAGQNWKRKVAQLCPGIRWVAHYALLGPYDFMDVFDAPDVETALKVSLLSKELGAVRAETWPAVAYEDFLPLAEQVEQVKA